MSVGTIGSVPRPRTGVTPLKRVRVPDELWNDLGEQATALGTNRSAVIIAFIRWWLGKDGAKLPERPGK